MKTKTICIIISFFVSTVSIFSQIVYVTSTGRMYHEDGCPSLRQSQIAVLLEDAVNSGYNPCSRCNPPQHDGSTTRINNAELYRVNIHNLPHSHDADTALMVVAEVVDHVDGDTVRVRIPNPPRGLSVVETVRLLGVDTPETVHPNKNVEHFGKEASDFTRDALLGQSVYLAFDWDLRDHYGRILAYIYTKQGECFNAALIYEGFSHAYLRFPFQFMDEFRDLEQEARKNEHGLWAEYVLTPQSLIP